MPHDTKSAPAEVPCTCLSATGKTRDGCPDCLGSGRMVPARPLGDVLPKSDRDLAERMPTLAALLGTPFQDGAEETRRALVRAEGMAASSRASDAQRHEWAKRQARVVEGASRPMDANKRKS